MARTALTVQQLSGPYPASLVMDDLTWAAADIANQNEVTLTGREIILARNDNAATKIVTITSIAGPHGRVGNITKSILTTEYAMWQASGLAGWLQSDGKLYLEGDDVLILFAVLRLK